MLISILVLVSESWFTFKSLSIVFVFVLWEQIWTQLPIDLGSFQTVEFVDGTGLPKTLDIFIWGRWAYRAWFFLKCSAQYKIRHSIYKSCCLRRTSIPLTSCQNSHSQFPRTPLGTSTTFDPYLATSFPTEAREISTLELALRKRKKNIRILPWRDTSSSVPPIFLIQ